MSEETNRELNLFKKSGAIRQNGEPSIKTGRRERLLREAAEHKAAKKERLIKEAREASIQKKKRKIARKKMAGEIALAALEAIGLAAAAWFMFRMAAMIEDDIIRERGGDPNIGFHGEYVGDPNSVPEDYEDYYVPDELGHRGR